ncbi:MAG: hypothetical protein U0P45_07850 [Acidimicrobiales bacterium]
MAAPPIGRQPWSIAGASIPWLGLGSLAVLVAVAAVGLRAVVRPSSGKGVAVAVLGWAATLPAAIVLAIGHAAPVFDAPDWMRDYLERASAAVAEHPVGPFSFAVPDDLRVQLLSGPGALLWYVAGCATVLAGWQICRSAERSTGSEAM